MLHTRGAYALMVDADGATDISCLEKILERTSAAEVSTKEGKMAVGIGSRAHYEKVRDGYALLSLSLCIYLYMPESSYI